ncbi:hypothetical protein ILUMI_21260 [Ignelater luminosus]|uniref:Activator of Hsp90 ATPase AHSA1-like N-terminal domain-containing protein n=1 Tax=Ignelater luminosus TaxID=2038154 RepID=A0A8K0CCR1_IGNLU|nr:hypothetical protein ILUMI_21260 [Ignelater luminosus]
MAKWGEGDPRWIVEERPDATNVNNWHWTERDASTWSKEKIKSLFNGVLINSNVANIEITEVEKCEGEASANNRKGKLIFFYEWKLVLKWQGKLVDGTGEEHSGTVVIPNLSEENDIHEIDIQITVKDNEGEGEILKDVMYNGGKHIIREKLSEYIAGLKEEFSKGMILPKKDEVKQDNIKNLSSGFNKKVSMQPVVSNSKPEVKKVDTSTLELKEKFQCRAQDLYDALTKIEMVTAFTRSEVKLDPVKGGVFELFGGNISGVFDELVPGQKIVQKWRYKQWPTGHFSTVNIKFDQKSDHTEINLVQTGVPKSEVDVTKQNWERYYWSSIKRTFGFGAFLP